jgi:HPt (histidine-containing phosphotransfer) domain-containing protein
VLLQRLGGDHEIYHEIIDLFLEDVIKQVRALEDAIHRGDAPGVQRQAHTLNGASANVGAAGLAEIAFQLERAGERHDLSRAGEMLDCIKTEFNRFEWIHAAQQHGEDHGNMDCQGRCNHPHNTETVLNE